MRNKDRYERAFGSVLLVYEREGGRGGGGGYRRFWTGRIWIMVMGSGQVIYFIIGFFPLMLLFRIYIYT